MGKITPLVVEKYSEKWKSLVVVGITIVLMGLTRKTKQKHFTTRMFNLNAGKINA